MLNRLSPPRGSRKRKTRRGRGIGSGLGKTSGRGHKGQNARSGGGVRPGFEGGQLPLHRRLPKRGFTNRFARRYEIVNLRDLMTRFQDGDEVTPEVLASRGLVRDARDPVKILGDTRDGEFTLRLTVRAHAFSAAARAKIEQAGGKAEVI